MTKEQILLTVKNAINQHTDNSPLGIAYKHGFEDGANYILQNLQQTPCTTLRESIIELMKGDELFTKYDMGESTNHYYTAKIIAYKNVLELIDVCQPLA